MVKKVKKTQRGGGNNSPNNNKRKLLELEEALREYGYAVYRAKDATRTHTVFNMLKHTNDANRDANRAANSAHEKVLAARDDAVAAANAVSKNDVKELAAKFTAEAANQGNLIGRARHVASRASLGAVASLAKWLADEHD